jgi:rare lipoprotein A
MHELTAANRKLPINAMIRVTNLTNGRQRKCASTTRGPFVANRVIDLSLSAAQAIEMVGPGTAHVRLEVISGPNPSVGYFGVQVGAFLVQENAARLKAQLESQYPPISIVPFESANGTFYRVRIGRLPSEEAARSLADQLHNTEQFTTFVVRLDN